MREFHFVPRWLAEFLLIISVALSQPCLAGSFKPIPSLTTARSLHTATLLPNGTVLVAGGQDTNANALASAEIYNPTTGEWSPAGTLTTARYAHSATLLPNGTVLVAGGVDNAGGFAEAEIYDPAIGRWSRTGNLITARAYHTATLLANGTVLVAGGSALGFVLAGELYDPTSGKWTLTGSLAIGRSSHTATLLTSGMVLVAGGFNDTGSLAEAELYDSASGTWSVTDSLATPRQNHAATSLLDGKVLVAGGADAGTSLASAELYDPATGSWTNTGSLSTARAAPAATLLSDGTVLVSGGFADSGASLNSAELYDRANGTWMPTGSLSNARSYHTSTLLTNGMVLVAGGVDNGNALASAELYDPGPPVITSPLASSATVNLPYSYQFEATGATTFDVTGLPPGLTFDSNLRAIIGNATVTGPFDITLSASNASGTTNAALTLTVQNFPAAGPIIVSPSSATGRTNSPFHFQVITQGGSPATSLTTSGLPTGLSADSMTGEISGTVTTDGSYLVTLTVTDGGATNTVTLELTFTSDLARPVIVSPISVNVYPGIPFSYAIVAPSTDTSDPITYSEIGPLPGGLDLDTTTGIISGTPTSAKSLLRPSPSLAGGVITNVQMFACNPTGCGSQGLLFLLPTGAVNISTRLSVGTDENVLIGGFITQGNAPSKLVVRGIGPSLPVYGALANPYLELHNGSSTIAANDNWKDDLTGGSQEIAIENTTLAPTNPLESAILAILDPGAYTAILHGANNGIGVGLVEVYELGAASLDLSSEAQLANISTRGFVQTGDNVMIGGFINQGAVPIQVLVRGIGPSLAQSGVANVLANPVLELHKPDGSVVTNDDWQTSQQTEIMATTIPPTDPLESAILLTLPVGQGAYTAIVRGANNTTGVGLVEAYFGNPCIGSSCP